MRAFGYCRVSTTEQGDSGAGLEAQEATIRAEIAHRGWELVEIRADVASGKSMRRREQLAATLTELRLGNAESLVVAKLDRLSRSMLDFAGIIATSRKEGWSLIALDLGVDTSTSNGKLIANIIMAMAEWERELIGERTKSALAIVKARGVKLGRPSVVDDSTRQLIRVLRATSLSWQGVADALTLEGIPTAQGGRWHAGTVRKLHG